MNLQHLNVKFFLAQPPDLAPFVGVFNEWIQRQLTPQRVVPELLIDVADYQHVVNGPGLLLIGHEANYSLDQAEGRWGLLYARKAAVDGTPLERLQQAACAALHAAHTLHTANGLAFNGHELQIVFNDRLLTPNTAATYQALLPVLQAFFAQAFGPTPYTLTRRPDPRERLTVTAQAATPIPFGMLQQRLTTP